MTELEPEEFDIVYTYLRDPDHPKTASLLHDCDLMLTQMDMEV